MFYQLIHTYTNTHVGGQRDRTTLIRGQRSDFTSENNPDELINNLEITCHP